MTSGVVQRTEMADRSATLRGCVQAMALNKQIYIAYLIPKELFLTPTNVQVIL